MYIGQPTETTERHELPNLVGLFCFHAFLSSNGGKGAALDKKMYTTIWALCKRVPLVPLSGVAMWRPLQFMARVLPIKSSSLSVDAAGKIEADHLKSVDNDLPKDVTALRMQLPGGIIFELAKAPAPAHGHQHEHEHEHQHQHQKQQQHLQLHQHQNQQHHHHHQH